MLDMKLYGENDRALSLRETQLAALEILKRVNVICEREGLRYWAMFGTLIGAVRHGGFIPWDDDLDIAMPRPDYEKLLARFRDHAPELQPLFAVTPDIDLGRPFLITRISDMRYRMRGEYGDYVPELGAFIDVYPLDGLGVDMDAALFLKARAHKLILSYLHASNFDYHKKDAGRVKLLLKKLLSACLGDPVKYQRRLSELCATYEFEESLYVTNLHWAATPDKSIYERVWFDASESLPFEGVEVPAPIGYDCLLRTDYGDYMRLPSEAERVGHHLYSIVRRSD